jgi:hypothetical protein
MLIFTGHVKTLFLVRQTKQQPPLIPLRRRYSQYSSYCINPTASAQNKKTTENNV